MTTTAVFSGATSSSLSVTDGNTLIVYGTDIGTIVSGGGEEWLEGGTAIDTIVRNGGYEFVSGGGKTSGTTVSSGGTEIASLYGSAFGTTVSSGGIERVYSGGTTSGTVLSGQGSVYSYEYVSGSATGTQVGSNGIEILYSGGTEDGAVVRAGGTLAVRPGGIATNTTVDGGLFGVVSATAIGTVVSSGATFAVLLNGTASATTLLPGGTLVLGDLTFVSGGTVVLNTSTDVLTVTEGSNSATLQLSGDYIGEYAHAAAYTPAGYTSPQGTGITVDDTPCYCRGTLIQTDLGEIAVEHLKIGDLVITHRGAARPIRWIGRRAYDGRFIAGDRDVLPIRFRAGSLADNIPARDLYVSPLHAFYLDGVLIPAWVLVNGGSIRQLESVTCVEYFHVELESHDVMFAEGAAAESFADDGGRSVFQNAAEFHALYPKAQFRPGEYYASRLESGPVVGWVRAGLSARSIMDGFSPRLKDAVQENQRRAG